MYSNYRIAKEVKKELDVDVNPETIRRWSRAFQPSGLSWDDEIEEGKRSGVIKVFGDEKEKRRGRKRKRTIPVSKEKRKHISEVKEKAEDIIAVTIEKDKAVEELKSTIESNRSIESVANQFEKIIKQGETLYKSGVEMYEKYFMFKKNATEGQKKVFCREDAKLGLQAAKLGSDIIFRFAEMLKNDNHTDKEQEDVILYLPEKDKK